MQADLLIYNNNNSRQRLCHARRPPTVAVHPCIPCTQINPELSDMKVAS
jgi:hypothetical protein